VPMRRGIDFGTARIVVTAADRGNYPLAGLESADGHAGVERRFLGETLFAIVSGPPRPPNDHAQYEPGPRAMRLMMPS
jgi:hypothetical protein